jgi:predicted transcriptional regulator
MQCNTCICGDIVNELPLAQPTVSEHLKELKNAELIKGEIDGNCICYCIDENTLASAKIFYVSHVRYAA